MTSEMTTGRLSVYLRCLTFLESMGQLTVSSAELAERFQLNSAQIRKDLACFGEFGTRGVGYNVSRLKDHLVRELGLDRTRRVLIAGAGNLGMALADYGGFNDHGFQIAALVDNDPVKIGRRSRSGIEVLPWDELPTIVREFQVDIGIVAVNAEAAQIVCDAFADVGLNAILNFAPTQLRARPGVKVKSVDLRINLESLSFYLKNVEDGDGGVGVGNQPSDNTPANGGRTEMTTNAQDPSAAADSMKNTIFQCLVAEFDTQGLNHISSTSARIVWIDIPDGVIAKLGNGVTACLEAKGIQVPALAVAFQDFKDSEQVTVVSDLITVIASLAG